MIPKIIHYVWLSGEQKPPLINDCIRSWKYEMPSYEIKEWTMTNLPQEVLDHPFVAEAIKNRKWAFATDYIRFYVVYHYGGIYMDSDIFVFKSLEPFMSSNGFTSFEESTFLRFEKKKKVPDFGLEAALFGAEKNSKWVKNILSFYKDLRFKNDNKFFISIIAPSVMWKQTIPFGIRPIQTFQKLEGDIRVYQSNLFSCVIDYKLYDMGPNEYKRIGEINCTKFACHLCSNSWGYQRPRSIGENIKEIIIRVIGKNNAINLKRKVFKRR